MYDYNSNDMHGTDGYRPHLHKSPMARISFVLGIVSLMTCMVIYISLPCGAMAVICALLARTDSAKSKKYRASIICGICGMVLTTALTAGAFYTVMTDPELFAIAEYYVQSYLGDYDLDLKEELGNLLPFMDGSSGSEDRAEGGTPQDQQENPSDDRGNDNGSEDRNNNGGSGNDNSSDDRSNDGSSDDRSNDDGSDGRRIDRYENRPGNGGNFI